MRIAELVPEIAKAPSLLICALEVTSTTYARTDLRVCCPEIRRHTGHAFEH